METSPKHTLYSGRYRIGRVGNWPKEDAILISDQIDYERIVVQVKDLEGLGRAIVAIAERIERDGLDSIESLV